ncbi:filamentous haemagglutinin family protein [Methylophilus sp. Leaf408]|uniref:filamentous haemagglutinin family protein n=1 Tax=Methylophilus sp. Leaf408 TaxID=2876561 RepID=UPI001E38BA68|nr:filamentous haemagglutinin family protein [Methylophilus sp. Leaf408]
MNQGLYKLVFSKIHRAMVVVSEIVSSHSGDGRSRTRHARRTAGICLALSMLPGPWMVMSAWADLPGGISIRDIVTPAGAIRDAAQVNVANIVSSSANHLNLQQLIPRAIINYNKFDLANGQSFFVDMQPGWSLLNRVHSVDPSYINGNVTGAGNIYFINANGVIIGKDAVFNVGSLYAGTLNIADDLFKAGFINDTGYNSVFELVGAIDPVEASRIYNAEVRVESGAQINASKGGKVMLFAPNVTVEKDAVIRTPDGQTILAAGRKIYLKSSKDPAGMLVEVASGGTATNLGKIVAERGNITMMGLAVNQMGTLSATTSVRANGSIKLLAQEDVSVTGGQETLNRNGIVTLGTGSVTEVKPDMTDTEEVLASLAFTPSDITIQGSLINIDGLVSAKGGNVNLNSQFEAAAVLNSPVTRRIHLGQNATIDVSGVDAIAPMSRNQVTVQLNSDALRDNPILRGSNLFGKTVYLDARKGTSLFNLQPYISATRMATVTEKMTNAGKVNLSAKEVVAEKGSVINVSGGSTTYTSGALKESQVLYNGRLVPISQALPGVQYNGIGDTLTVTDRKWGTTTTLTLGNLSYNVAGFMDGANAGTISITPNAGSDFVQKLVLDGSLLGNTKIGAQQLLDGRIPQGATLQASARNLDLVASVQNLAPDFEFGDVLADDDNFISRIGTGFLRQGFNHINFTDVLVLNVNTALNLDPKGEIAMGILGGTVNINKDIIARGSNVALNAQVTNIADNVTISTAGNFVNNRTGLQGAMTKQTVEDAGDVKIGLAVFGKGVKLDASAGAYVDSKGALHTGQAGDIGFSTESQLPGDLSLSAYGFDKGGELNIQFAPGRQYNLHIGAPGVIADGSNFTLANSFFSEGGFSKYHLGSFNIHVGADNAGSSLVYGVAQTLQMRSGYDMLSSTDNIFGLTRLITQPDYLRQAVSFDFATFVANSALGVLTVHENAHIKTDAGGSVQLAAEKQLNVLGDVTAKGGDITLKINDVDATLPEDTSQMVFIGDQARLDASGTSFALPGSRAGLPLNKLVNAGTITVNSTENGAKGALVIKQGAVLDVSATQVTTTNLTNRSYLTETLYGDAGFINLYGYGSLLVDGTLSGHAKGTGRGGSLSMLFEGVDFTSADPYLNESGRFHVTNQLQLLASGIQAGTALKDTSGPITPASGQLQRAQISAQQIESGGFDNVRLGSFIRNADNSNSRLSLAADLDLAIAGNLRLDSAVLQVLGNGHAQINAGHLQLYSRKQAVDPSILTGSGELSLNANQIYIDGLVATSGVNRTNLNAMRDIHGQGATSFAELGKTASDSGLTTQGELNLVARQVYPDTGAKLTFNAQGANSRINVRSSGLAPVNVLSGGGILTLQADHIQQDGVLKAPFGQINLIGNQSLTLGAGSLTSVSGNGMIIPFGVTRSAGEVFNPDGGATRNLVEKVVLMKAPNTQTNEGAVIDASGGGDLFAYEWIEGGVGGTRDILADPNTYALIPGMVGEYAGMDRNFTNESKGVVEFGQTIYITGVAGIPSGNYTLLPARYALVPGAFVVQRSDASLLRGQTTALQDGSMLTTGYMADLNTGAKDANWSTFRVINGNVFRPADGTVSQAPSQYMLTNASTFFSDPLNTNGVNVKTTQDAGTLSLEAQQLTLAATVVANRITGADGLMVDISSDNIRVVSDVDSADNTSLQLKASQLNALNAESILLGGTRSQGSNGTNITTVASSVSVENDADHALNVVEFLASATDNISVATGAVINTGAANANAKTVNINTSGDGAFLGLSSGSTLSYTRRDPTLNSVTGTLNIAANAQLGAGNALVMDASRTVSFAGDITLASGAHVTLGSNRILIGSAPSSVSGLHVDDQTLAQLDNVSNLTLNSYSTVDTYGSVDFGNDKLNLTVNAAGIAGHLADGEVSAPANQSVTFNTKSFTLKNTVDASYMAPADPSGRTLQINAETVSLQGDRSAVLNNNTVASGDRNTLGGYNAVRIDAKTLTVAERGALDLQVNQTTLNVGRISAESSANYNVGSSGTLTTSQGNTSGLAANSNIGGALTLQANNLQVNSRIETLGGQVNLQGTSQLHLGSQAVVSAASASKTFADKTLYVDAGKVQLNSSGGNISVDNGAVVDVSARGDADAGKVNVSAANGNLLLQGQLDGRAHGSGHGGALAVDVHSLPSIAAVDQQAQGFSLSRSYRARTGDIAIDGTGSQALTAQQVAVSADQGAITVSGTINANSNKQGSISLYAHDDLTLQGSAQLTANSSKAGAEGGKVLLATSNGALNLEQGSSIQVAAGSGGTGGSVQLRTPRTGAGSGNGVAVNQLATSINGAQSVVLEAFRVYNNVDTISSSGGAAGSNILDHAMLATDVTDFMANQASILAALGKGGDSTFHLRVGQEVRSSGDLTMDADWDLYTTSRAGNEPGVLTLRAANNLYMNGSLSDGFAGSDSSATIGEGNSWSYRLVAGADLAAANMMNTVPSAVDSTGNSVTGNLVLADGKLIRTGTGDIEIATGGDLTMTGVSSVIYTAGVQAATLTGFTLPAVTQKPLYLDNGGDIRLDVAGSIWGAETDISADRQVINQWLFRQGFNGTTVASIRDTSWWVRPDLFQQSLAALGGGNVTINAGNNIANFSASVPTTARYDNFGAGATANNIVNGGGDLAITAGGNLMGGTYFIGKGAGSIKVDGSIDLQADKQYGTILAMMEGRWDVSAAKDVRIEATINPTLLPQSSTNSNTSNSSYFNSYAQSAAVHVESVTGNVRYAYDTDQLYKDSGLHSAIGGQNVNPGTLDLTSVNEGISLGTAYLVPYSQGNVSLLAEKDVKIGVLMMSDANWSDIPSIHNPVRASFFNDAQSNLTSREYQYFNNHATSLVHANDTQSSYIVSRSGNIEGNLSPTEQTIVPGLIYIPEKSRIVAGQDVTQVNIALQNSRSSDISVVAAGRDVNTKNIVIAGPGELLVQAGRNIDLVYNDITNIQATGNTGTSNAVFEYTPALRANTSLPEGGASISLLAGVGPGGNVQDYIDLYISPTGAGPALLAGNGSGLSSYRQATAAYLLAFMQKLTGNVNLTAAGAYTQFLAQPDAIKTVFVNRHLTSELVNSAEGFAKAGNHQRAYDALDTLYPTKYAGDILMFNSKISTNSGGSIDLITPSGLINVGVPGKGGDIGVITEKGGEIRAIADGDFSVNQSKVITQFGSDITIWSTNGTIDAGRGSKAATSIPERIVQTDVYGNTRVEVRGVASGSGIRAQNYDPDGPSGRDTGPNDGKAGNVILIAPVVDAGEAGIEAGDLFIVAPVVLNTANIQVQGTSSGVPVAAANSLAGVSTGLSPDSVNAAAQAVAQNVANSAATSTLSKPVLPSIISVDVIGIGR